MLWKLKKLFSGASLKVRLMVGFLMCAILTGLSGGAGIYSLRQIQNNMLMTSSEIGVNIGEQNTTTRQLMSLRKLVTAIVNTDEAVQFQEIRKDIVEIEKIYFKDIGTKGSKTLATIKTLAVNKERELRTREELASLNKTNTAVLKEVNTLAMAIADNVEFESTINIEEVTQKVKNNSDNISSINQSVLTTIKAALAVRSNCNALNAATKDLLLATDVAVVEYGQKTLNLLIDDTKTQILQIPTGNTTSEISQQISVFTEEISKLIEMKKRSISYDHEPSTVLTTQRQKLETALKQITSLALMVVDNNEFDSAIIIEEAGSELDNNFNNMAVTTAAAVSTIKTVLLLRSDCNELNGQVKNALLTTDPAKVDYAKIEVNTLIDKISKALAGLPENEDTSNLTKAMDRLTAQTRQLLEKKKSLLLAHAELDQTIKQIQETMCKVDSTMLDTASSMKSHTDERLNTSTSVVRRWQAIQFVLVIIALVLAIFVGIFVSSSITNPLKKAVHMLKDIAEGQGDLTARLETKSNDEIGELAKWFNIFIKNIQSIIKRITSNAKTLDTSSTTLLEISRSMNSRAQETSGKANNVASAAEEMSSNMDSVAAATEEASTNMGSIATAADQMTPKINEIAKSTEKARCITEEAVQKTKRTSDKMDELGRAAEEIGKVTETITEISEQTNLLALNATIEAARAGEAGKGFAVVAHEIKELARQTATATQEIRSVIEGIQGSTDETVDEIKDITRIIDNISKIVSSIASAMEVQSVTTHEIANNVTQASHGIQEMNANIVQSSQVSGQIAQDIVEVNQAANEISLSSGQLNANAEELSKLANHLKDMVDKFRV